MEKLERIENDLKTENKVIEALDNEITILKNRQKDEEHMSTTEEQISGIEALNASDFAAKMKSVTGHLSTSTDLSEEISVKQNDFVRHKIELKRLTSGKILTNNKLEKAIQEIEAKYPPQSNNLYSNKGRQVSTLTQTPHKKSILNTSPKQDGKPLTTLFSASTTTTTTSTTQAEEKHLTNSNLEDDRSPKTLDFVNKEERGKSPEQQSKNNIKRRRSEPVSPNKISPNPQEKKKLKRNSADNISINFEKFLAENKDKLYSDTSSETNSSKESPTQNKRQLFTPYFNETKNKNKPTETHTLVGDKQNEPNKTSRPPSPTGP